MRQVFNPLYLFLNPFRFITCVFIAMNVFPFISFFYSFSLLLSSVWFVSLPTFHYSQSIARRPPILSLFLSSFFFPFYFRCHFSVRTRLFPPCLHSHPWLFCECRLDRSVGLHHLMLWMLRSLMSSRASQSDCSQWSLAATSTKSCSWFWIRLRIWHFRCATKKEAFSRTRFRWCERSI